MRKKRHVVSGAILAAAGISVPMAAEAADSALAPPDGVVVTSGPGGVAVQWEDTSDAGGFDIYVNGQYVDTVFDARFDDPNGAPNTTYQVVAFDHNKSNHSPKSLQAVGEGVIQDEPSTQPSGTDNQISSRVTQDGDQTVTRFPDGYGGYTEVRADSEGNIVTESIMVANIDGNGTSELSVFVPSRNTTTTYVTSKKSSEMVTTTVYHDTNTTIVETLNEYGETVERVTNQDGTITTLYDVDFEPISITSSAGVVYTGLDLEIIEGTEYRIWEYKEAYAAVQPTHRQLKVLHAVYELYEPTREPDTSRAPTFGQQVADEWAGGDNVNGEFGGSELDEPTFAQQVADAWAGGDKVNGEFGSSPPSSSRSSSGSNSSSNDSDSSSGSDWSSSSNSNSSNSRSDNGSSGGSAQDAADEYAGGNNEGGEFG